MRPIPVTSRNGQLQIAVACTALLTSAFAVAGDDLDLRVQAALRNAGLTGTIQAQLVPSTRSSGIPIACQRACQRRRIHEMA